MNYQGTVSPEVWGGFLEYAYAVNEYTPTLRSKPQGGGPGIPAGEDSPGTDFNRRGSWAEAGLFDAGWAWFREVESDRGLIRRPGKDVGNSASVGMAVSKENGWPLFYCWSTSVKDFVPEEPYTRFAVFAVLKHKGDYAAAAKELASRGYGRPMPKVPEVVWGTAEGEGSPPQAAPDRLFLWMSELQFRPANDKWIWHGFLSRGGITLLSALWKAGKSTLLAHLIRAFDGRSGAFLNLPVTPSRVLYITEEHEEMWAERRDELNIGDHVGMICRPFKGRPSPAEWTAFIGKVATAVAEYRFDLVVMDTISKLWPVREENDAGQVEDALMPLWSITTGGAAMLLVHHNRKSDGKEFTGSRGSGGLPAFMETLIEFRRNTESKKDPKRLIKATGRYKETPDHLLIELTPSGYVSHGDPDEMTPDQKAEFGIGNQDAAERWKSAVLRMLPTNPDEAMTLDALMVAVRNLDGKSGVREIDLTNWLRDRVKDGEIQKTGRGAKGSPARWHKVSSEPTIIFNSGHSENEPDILLRTPRNDREENREENVYSAERQTKSDEMLLPDSPPDVSGGSGGESERPTSWYRGRELGVALNVGGPMAPSDLAARSGYTEAEVAEALADYISRGVIELAEGVYRLVKKGGSS